MLVKVGTAVALNMTGIDSVIIRPIEKVTRTGQSLFSKGVERRSTEWHVEIYYRNADGKPDHFKLRCGENYTLANQVKDEVISQAKEIENVGATQALEEAIRNG